LIESYGLNDQPAMPGLHINERANHRSMEIAENPALIDCLGVQINTPGSQSRTDG
jgi:hypothetical protein